MEVSTSIHHFLFFIKNFAHDSILFTLPHPTLPRFNLLHILLMTVSYLHLSPKDNLYVRPFNGVWSTYWWQHWENWSLPQQLGISHRTLASGGTLWPTAQGIQLFSLVYCCSLRHGIKYPDFIRAAVLCVQNTLIHCIYTLSIPSSTMIPKPLEEGVGYICSI